MKVIISDSLYIDSEGKGYRLRQEGQRNAVGHYGTLSGVADRLVSDGIIPVEAVQTGEQVTRLCSDVDHAFKALCPDHATAVAMEASLRFGAFEVVVNRPGGYWLLNSDKGVPMLKDRYKGEYIVVGYPGSIRHAFQLACERVLQAQPESIPYAGLDAAFLDIANCVLGKAVATLNGVEHRLTSGGRTLPSIQQQASSAA